jgi:hypothetical protein
MDERDLAPCTTPRAHRTSVLSSPDFHTHFLNFSAPSATFCLLPHKRTGVNNFTPAKEKMVQFQVVITTSIQSEIVSD